MNNQRFDMITFLEEYERFPCLWKKSSPDFKNRVKRDHAEELLLPVSGLSTIKELRQKIRSIRCTYNQEVAKIRKSMGTGTGAGTVYKPKLTWFPVADSFLRQNSEENESQSNLILPEQVLEENQGNAQPALANEEAIQEPWECEKNTSVNSIRETQTIRKRLNTQPTTPNQESAEEPSRDYEETPSVNSARKTKTSRKRPANNGRNKEDDSLDQAIKVLKEVTSVKSVASNEFDAFGQHVSSQLKCLPLQDAIILQEDIQKLITSIRLRYLKNQNVINTSFDKETQSTTCSSGTDLQDTIDPSTSSGGNERYNYQQGQKPLLINYFKNWSESDDNGVDYD